MKLYNCPDCMMDNCEGCPRLIVGHKLRVPTYIPKYPVTYQSPQAVSPCRSCPNSILNGGSGICHCTLGGIKITCVNSSNPNINGKGGLL